MRVSTQRGYKGMIFLSNEQNKKKVAQTKDEVLVRYREHVSNIQSITKNYADKHR